MTQTYEQQDLAYLSFLRTWKSQLPEMKMEEAFPNPERGALVSVDIINGFCTIGPLASDRIQAIVGPITDLMARAWDHGVRHYLLAQDTHEPDAKEFGAYPPHCVRGTAESDTVPEIKALPFYGRMTIIEKNSIAMGLNTIFTGWLADHPEVNTFVVVGDCTDLCVYQSAMYLRLDANAHQLDRRVIVPANAVDTYDTPLEFALEKGITPHPAELLHHVFLHHMALNGIEVVGCIV
ncbi:MAG TPA: isochorismatase family protein [Chloroflexi bacterium]|nr:isochorismatase family protein [Chloroflexota bacterium]HPO58654.1 isochorismatase family protein [Anaerolineaceae bacterium]